MRHKLDLLPGVPEAYVSDRLKAAGGSEIESGKFRSPDSSAALAVNALAWFHARPALLPPLPSAPDFGWPPTRVDVEYCARFPWAGGRHPWLDALVETTSHMLGIESKRHEPFRDTKRPHFSDAYDRSVWEGKMAPYGEMKNALKAAPARFRHLDATQLVKHALGLFTDSNRRGSRKPILIYLYDEPIRWPRAAVELHRQEIQEFSKATEGSAVPFVAVCWREWVDSWIQTGDKEVKQHGSRLVRRFELNAQRSESRNE